MSDRRTPILIVLLLTTALLAPATRAQQPAPADAAPAPAAQKPKNEAKPAPALPGLDELLGLPPEKKPADAGAPGSTPEERELDRALRARQVSEMFAQAVQQMADAATLLRDERDPGLATQRVQEEIITKLEKLIEEAERQQQKSSSSSSSSKKQGSQQRRQPKQSQKSQAQNRGRSPHGENRGERTPPGAQSAKLNGQIDALKAAWGALPARVREALLQGAGDTYSSLYQSLTEAYYKRLAEQDKEPQ